MSKYFREQGIEMLRTSLEVIWETRVHKEIFKGNKDPLWGGIT